MAEIINRKKVEIDLQEKGTLREMLDYLLQILPSQYLDMRLNMFTASIARAGVLKLLDILNIFKK